MKTNQCRNCGRLFISKQSEKACPECSEEYDQKLKEQKELALLGQEAE